MSELKASNVGTVVSVRGSVLDVRFPGKLPSLYSELRAGDNGDIVIEVLTQLNSETVRRDKGSDLHIPLTILQPLFFLLTPSFLRYSSARRSAPVKPTSNADPISL